MTARKRINHRQWFHRLIHRKCWNCNQPLVCDPYRDGRSCPICGHFYGETLMCHLEDKTRRQWWKSPWTAA